MYEKLIEDIKVTAVVRRPPYFHDDVFSIPVEIQDVEISENLQAYLNKKDNTVKADTIELNMRCTKEVTFNHILPILKRSIIAFYPGLKEVEQTYAKRPVERIEILDGPNILASYER